MKPSSEGFFFGFFMSQYVIPIALIIVGIVSLILARLEDSKNKLIYVVPILICFFSLLFITENTPTFWEKNILVIVILVYWLVQTLYKNLKASGKNNLKLEKILSYLTMYRLIFISIAILNFYYTFKWFRN